jgi:hypothetical protein
MDNRLENITEGIVGLILEVEGSLIVPALEDLTSI